MSLQMHSDAMIYRFKAANANERNENKIGKIRTCIKRIRIRIHRRTVNGWTKEKPISVDVTEKRKAQNRCLSWRQFLTHLREFISVADKISSDRGDFVIWRQFEFDSCQKRTRVCVCMWHSTQRALSRFHALFEIASIFFYFHLADLTASVWISIDSDATTIK